MIVSDAPHAFGPDIMSRVGVFALFAAVLPRVFSSRRFRNSEGLVMKEPQFDSTAGRLFVVHAELEARVQRTPHRDTHLENNLACVEAALGECDAAAVKFAELLEESASAADSIRTAVVRNHAVLQQFTDRRLPALGGSDRKERRRIAVVSLLFNWPSTGGGTVHTKELCEFLFRAGYPPPWPSPVELPGVVLANVTGPNHVAELDTTPNGIPDRHCS